IQDPKFHLVLFKNYLKENGIDVDFKALKRIDEMVNAHVDFNQYTKYKRYRFKYVKWSNYLSYGTDNYFDFTRLHGLVLLSSVPGNQGGKTTFAINLLRFALFGKSEKSPNLNDVFNRFHPEETEVKVEACLEIDGVDYVIRRTIVRPPLKKRTDKSKPKQKVEYFKLINGEYDLIENCEGESTQQTNNIIRETVGEPDDFDLVISATKKTLDGLFYKGQTEKGRLFSRWLGLLSLEDKENVAKDIWKKQISPTLLCNKYDRATLASEVTDYETCNKENEDAIKQHESGLSEIEEEISKLTTEKEDVLKSRKEINSELEKLDVATIENRLKMKNDELEIKREQLTAKKDEYAKVKDAQFSQDDYNGLKDKIKEKNDKKHSIELKNAELKTTIASLRSENKRIQELIDGGTCPTCGQSIDVKQQNGSIEKNELEVNRLITNGTTNKQRIDKIAKEIEELENKVVELDGEREKVNERQRLEPTMIAIKANIDTIKLEIEKLENQRKDIESNRENIKYNNEIDNKIRIIGATIVEKTRIKDQHIRDIQSCKNNIEFNNLKIEERKTIIAKLTEEDKTVKEWQVYQELVGKNGVVKIVLKQALPILNNEIKRTLEGLCDFEVVLDVDEKNDVCINLVSDGCTMPIEKAASGFEGTFAGIAVRNALASISSLSRPNYITLDEIDSTVHPENQEVLYELYKRILGNYDFIFHVVHTDNEDIIAKHDMVVTVVKDNHVSKIEI
ncbi:MAG: hypothetical protein J6X18_16415, partial [Bacteroidales bacterium]|nr:hypothetical protein [Bacteroidales bacterium]